MSDPFQYSDNSQSVTHQHRFGYSVLRGNFLDALRLARRHTKRLADRRLPLLDRHFALFWHFPSFAGTSSSHSFGKENGNAHFLSAGFTITTCLYSRITRYTRRVSLFFIIFSPCISGSFFVPCMRFCLTETRGKGGEYLIIRVG